MVFALLCILSYLFYTKLRKKINNKYVCAATSYIIAGIIISAFTFSGCADGWLSNSIGAQGACSYHGGVNIQLNIFGWIIFFLSPVCLILNIQNSNKKRIDESFIKYPCYGYNKNTKTYFLKTNSRPKENKIRKHCVSENIGNKFKHSVESEQIIANFTFSTEEDLKKVLKIQSECT